MFSSKETQLVELKGHSLDCYWEKRTYSQFTIREVRRGHASVWSLLTFRLGKRSDLIGEVETGIASFENKERDHQYFNLQEFIPPAWLSSGTCQKGAHAVIEAVVVHDESSLLIENHKSTVITLSGQYSGATFSVCHVKSILGFMLLTGHLKNKVK